MIKKLNFNNISYREELINSIEPKFIFKNRPINRLKIIEDKVKNFNLDKTSKLNELKKLINSIQKCNLKNHSNKLIFGDGNSNGSIMIVGEAPGKEEERSGKTFQGDVGSLLKKMLLAININIDNIYSTYSINYRPPEDRKPTSQEIKRYSVFLKEHISIIDPKMIILFGSSAMESVAGLKTNLSNNRGKWKEIILKNKTYPIMITFSPSYLIRFPENKKYSWEDLKKIRDKIKKLEIKT